MPKAKPSEPSLFISRVHAAEMLDCSVQLIDKYILNETLHPVRIGRKVILRRAELLNLAETGGFPVLPNRRSRGAR